MNGMKVRWSRNFNIGLSLLVFGYVLLPLSYVYAVSSSNNYKIEEDFIGGGGLIEESSSQYKANESIGDIGVGNSSSTNFQTNSGYTTTNDPALTFIVNTSTVNFGSLSPTVATTATASFSVINYTSFGYIVQVVGSTLSRTSPAYSIPALATQTASSPGTEQFGMNLVSNSSPSVGANPSQQPDATFGFGSAATNYGTTNQFRFVTGDTVSQATKDSGRTDYTISYLVNTKSTTPAGQYSTSQILICTGTY
jgi:hypothetical protein